MSVQKFYGIYVNGVMTNERKRFRDAQYIADKKRDKHGVFAVVVRPHIKLV
jgi:hypothetical protein